MSFDPATVTLDDVESLTVDQIREVLAHHKAPGLPKTIRKAEAVDWAKLTLAAHAPRAAIEAPPNGDSPEAAPLEAPPDSVVPTEKRWDYIVRMGEYLSRSNLTPEALRGKPTDVVAVLLRSNDLGIPLTAGLDTLYVVHGRVGMEAKTMRALVRRDGHSITDAKADPDSDEGWDRATVRGRRADGAQDEAEVTFTLADAVEQGMIVSYERDSRTRRAKVTPARGKDQWSKMPTVMCKHRATSTLCRDLFSDCLAGVSYTPEELDLGEYVSEATGDGKGAPAGRAEEVLTAAQMREQMSERISRLDPDLVDEVRAEWASRRLPPLARIEGAPVRTALRLIEGAETKQGERDAAADDEIDDIEVIACGVCGDSGDVESLDDGRVLCRDRQACSERVLAAASAAAEAPVPPTDPNPAPGPETATETVSEPVAADDGAALGPCATCGGPGWMVDDDSGKTYCRDDAPF